ncbi:MAG: NADH-quinone oxidoreductase subunit A [Planctomycetota bacterium]|jgi:NADH-quinone oxidoreductase subunit A
MDLHYQSVLVFLLFGMAAVIGGLAVLSLVRPKKITSEKLLTYECGKDPIGDGQIRFDMRFYTIALVFVIFDVEIAFLFPWAKVYQSFIAEGNGGIALFEGLIFIVILFIGLIYVWVKGDLQWVKAFKSRQSSEEA